MKARPPELLDPMPPADYLKHFKQNMPGSRLTAPEEAELVRLFEIASCYAQQRDAWTRENLPDTKTPAKIDEKRDDRITGFELEVLWQLFRNGPTRDGGLIDKQGRTDLTDRGFVARALGWNWLTENGVHASMRRGFDIRKDEEHHKVDSSPAPGQALR